ncbi:MAG: DUF2911 domain-containing protein [Roseivirga sp.]|nr:DUF2911 domain-containing protein [Roseivirga sp.]
MKKILILLSLLSLSLTSQAQITIPRESQYAEVMQRIGFTDIRIEYTRPNMKNRKIFGEGEMVPYGTVWRTGANASTKLSASKDIYLEGNRIPAGDYALYTIPQPGDWTIIVSKDTSLWGHYGYKEENDLLRFNVTPGAKLDHQESLAIFFDKVNDKQAVLNLRWGKHVIPISVKIDEKAQDAQIVADIKKTLALPDDRDKPIVVAHDYFHAAVYYMETNREPEQALNWFDKAIALEDVSYFNLYKSDLLGKLKRYDEAIEASKLGLAIFMVTGNNKEWIWRYEQQIEKWKKLKSGS